MFKHDFVAEVNGQPWLIPTSFRADWPWVTMVSITVI